MNTRKVGILASLALIAGARAANADTAESPWGVAVYGGDSVAEAGSLRSPLLPRKIPDLGTVNPALGATRLDALRANFLTPDAAVDLPNVHFTRTATVFSQSLETGVEFNPTTRFGVRFSVDADHLGDPPSAHDPALSALDYDASHDAEGRWTFPVALAASYHFG